MVTECRQLDEDKRGRGRARGPRGRGNQHESMIKHKSGYVPEAFASARPPLPPSLLVVVALLKYWTMIPQCFIGGPQNHHLHPLQMTNVALKRPSR